MARKIQLGALILGMLFVGIERFTAHADARTTSVVAPLTESGGPVPPPQ